MRSSAKKLGRSTSDGWTASQYNSFERGAIMNIRKNIDYTELYAAIDSAMEAAEKKQMEQYCEIGKVVCQRTEKGAAVAAAEYLAKKYPNVQGFSPRNLRRMRDFYRAYEDQPALLSLALQLGWTQNVVILEADLSVELREWYLKAAKQFGWSKVELTKKIATHAHEVIVFMTDEKVCDVVEQRAVIHLNWVDRFHFMVNKIQNVIRKTRSWRKSKKGFRRRWSTLPCQIFTKKRNAFMRCTNVLDFYRILCYTVHD